MISSGMGIRRPRGRDILSRPYADKGLNPNGWYPDAFQDPAHTLLAEGAAAGTGPAVWGENSCLHPGGELLPPAGGRGSFSTLSQAWAAPATWTGKISGARPVRICWDVEIRQIGYPIIQGASAPYVSGK